MEWCLWFRFSYERGKTTGENIISRKAPHILSWLYLSFDPRSDSGLPTGSFESTSCPVHLVARGVQALERPLCPIGLLHPGRPVPHSSGKDTMWEALRYMSVVFFSAGGRNVHQEKMLVQRAGHSLRLEEGPNLAWIYSQKHIQQQQHISQQSPDDMVNEIGTRAFTEISQWGNKRT